MTEDLEIGLVGCGEIARKQHAPFLLGAANDTGLRLVATADPGGGLPGASCRHYPDHRAMLLAESTLRAVAIASPTGTHNAIARDALRAGRHVLLEKPPTTTLAELEELARIARECGVVLVTSFHARHNAAVARLRRILSACPPPTHVEIEWREDFERWHAGQAWPWRPGGFGVFDPGINALSVLCHVLPELAFHVTRAFLRIPAGSATPSLVEMRLGWEGGAGDVAFEWRRGGADVWDIGLRSADANGRTRTLLLRSLRTLLVDGEVICADPQDAEYAGVYRTFRDALARGEPDVSTRESRVIEQATAIAQVERTLFPF